MEAHANKGFASRIGFGLGTFVRFLITDPKPLRRWVKRALVFGTLLVQFPGSVHDDHPVSSGPRGRETTTMTTHKKSGAL